MATGGGAHKYFDRLRRELGVEVRREEEMECLVLGLGFVLEVPNEVFWFSDELVQAISHPHAPPFEMPILPDPSEPLPRPSPNPPKYNLLFDSKPGPVQFPFLLVNIGSGVSMLKVDDYDKFERISGTSLGGGTLWGLLSLLTGAKSFDEMLSLADKGDNSAVDMLVGDIYGQDYQKIGLKSSTIASSFGKVFRQESLGEDAPVVDRKEQSTSGGAALDAPPCTDVPPIDEEDRRKRFKAEDISRSLLYAISNNIGQIAYVLFYVPILSVLTACLKVYECRKARPRSNLLRRRIHPWTCYDNIDALLRYTILVEGNQARVVPSTRRLLGRHRCLAAQPDRRLGYSTRLAERSLDCALNTECFRVARISAGGTWKARSGATPCEPADSRCCAR